MPRPACTIMLTWSITSASSRRICIVSPVDLTSEQRVGYEEAHDRGGDDEQHAERGEADEKQDEASHDDAEHQLDGE